MRDRTTSLDRRTALRTLTTSVAVGLAGCLDSTGATQSDPFTHVQVAGTTLVVEFEDDQPLDRITVIQPNGDAFADRAVTPGATRETVELGTRYPPGEYTIRGVGGDDSVGERTLPIVPDVRISTLKLGRNHPEEMYEGASDLSTHADVILPVENQGVGPDAVTKLQFQGDIPQPNNTGDEQSGIYDTTSEVGGEAESVVVPPGEPQALYSTSRPFTSASSNVSCTPEGYEGRFTATIGLRIGESIQREYDVEYTGEELIDCDIRISKVER